MKRLRFLLIIFLLIIPGVIHAEDFEYTLFQSRIDVNKDRTLNITETFNIYDTDSLASFTRSIKKDIHVIDERNEIYGEISNISSKTNIDVEDTNVASNVTFNINSVNSKLGIYKLYYEYNMGKDNTPKKDVFYYNIIDGMNNNISNLLFEVNMPQKVSMESIQLFVDGKKLTEDQVDLTLEDDKKIIGYLNLILEKGQTLSIKMELPNGYFEGGTSNAVYLNIFCLIPSILIFLGLIILFIKYGLGKQVNIKNEDKITNKYDPVELSYLYKGASMSDDIASILIYLANEGYLKIVENDDGYKLGKMNSFYFIKLKDYDKNNAVQEIIFNNIFESGDTVELKDIEYVFADHFEEANNMINSGQNRKRFFFNDFDTKKHVSAMIIMFASLFLTFYPFYLVFNIGILAIIASIIFGIVIYRILKLSKGSKRNILTFIFFALIGLNIYSLYTKIILLDIYCVGIVFIILSIILCDNLTNRTKMGINKLNDAYSFKNYLLNIDIEEVIVKNLYFEMIPYAYVLGILSTWLEKGIGHVVSGPDWYEMSPGKETFKINEFNAFIRNVIYETSIAITRQSFSEHGKVEYKNTTENKLNN